MNLNPFNLFKGNKAQGVKNETNFIGRTSIGLSNPGKYMGLDLHSDTYASAFPSIRAISNEYMTVLPKAIDANGKPVQNNNIVNALFHPNQMDSVVSFNEKIAVSTLVLPKTYILVWRNERGEAKPGGDFGFKGSKIAGFTFLENPGISRRYGKTWYNMGSQWFTEDDVMVLSAGVDPHNLYGGYSPTIAACRWITLDDYIADFQKGFFENNAIPAGMFKITAATVTEYEDIVRNMKARHKGSGNNNNVTYSHAPIDPATGKAAEAKIEFIPFQQSNKDIDFKSLFEQANHRIDTAYGVPAIVKGIDDAATYANAQVAEAGFAKRAVRPLLTRNYAQITHELNRITGGMGVAITFDYDIPSVADEEKVVAETNVIHANLVTTLETSGYSLDTIVDAFELPARIKLLKKGEAPAVIENDKAEVDEGDEVNDSPDPEKIDGVTPLNNKGDAKRTNPKAKMTNEERLRKAADKYLKAQVNRAISEYTQDTQNAVEPEPTSQEEDDFVDEAMAAIVAILLLRGAIGYDEATEMLAAAGLSTSQVTSYTLSEATKNSYNNYMHKVGQSYGADTAKSIRAVLARGEADGLNAAQMKKELRNILNTDQWRVDRLVKTELNRSQQLGFIDGIKEIQAQTGIQFEKSLQHDGTPECEWCKSLEDVWFSVSEPILPLNGVLVGVDGGILVNDFVENDGYDVHPNGNGYMVTRIRQ